MLHRLLRAGVVLVMSWLVLASFGASVSVFVFRSAIGPASPYIFGYGSMALFIAMLYFMAHRAE